MTRCLRKRRVLFVEEPTFGAAEPVLDVSPRGDRIFVAVPRLPDDIANRHDAQIAAQTQLVRELVERGP